MNNNSDPFDLIGEEMNDLTALTSSTDAVTTIFFPMQTNIDFVDDSNNEFDALTTINPIDTITINRNCLCKNHVCQEKILKNILTCQDDNCSNNHFKTNMTALDPDVGIQIISEPCMKYPNPPNINRVISFSKLNKASEKYKKNKSSCIFEKFKNSKNCEQCSLIDFTSLKFPHKDILTSYDNFVNPNSKLSFDIHVRTLFSLKELIRGISKNFTEIQNYGNKNEDNSATLKNLYLNLCKLLIIFDRSYLKSKISIFGQSLCVYKTRFCLHQFYNSLHKNMSAATLLANGNNLNNTQFDYTTSQIAKQLSPLILLCCNYFLFSESNYHVSARKLLLNVGKEIIKEKDNLRTSLLFL